MGQRVAHLRQQSLPYLDRLFHPFLPPALLAQADEGPNSRERVFTVRRTFFGFLYQEVGVRTKFFHKDLDLAAFHVSSPL